MATLIFTIVRKAKQIIQNLEVTGYAAEGKSLGHYNGKVVFVEGSKVYVGKLLL